jgi:MoxR-like ATPase
VATKTRAGEREVEWFAATVDGLVSNMGAAIKGAQDTMRRVVLCLVAEGHILIEDVPGVGKTSLARALAASVDLSWHRIQFTPDLLPSDVTGVSVYDPKSQQFQFRPGPIFANLIVADEINRASPKTQSALLEVMEERRVTVDAVGHDVPQPFMVIATQNPVEMDGTYRLPEAQLDRFLMRVSLGYPSRDQEAEVIQTHRGGGVIEELLPVARAEDIAALVEIARRVEVSGAVLGYVVDVCAATRSHPDARLGVSPRAGLALTRAATALAAAQARPYVTPDDVRACVEPVLAHRMLLTREAELRQRRAEDVVLEALRSVPVPHGA